MVEKLEIYSYLYCLVMNDIDGTKSSIELENNSIKIFGNDSEDRQMLSMAKERLDNYQKDLLFKQSILEDIKKHYASI